MLKIGALKYFAVFYCVFLFFSQANAGDVSNSELMQEIEKNLIFDKDSRSRVDVYQSNQSVKKSDYTISAGKEKASSDQKGEIKIVVTDTKSENFDLRQKEKLAYNAVLIGQYEVAVELYKQVLKIEPNNNYSKFALAVVYQKLGQGKQAKAIYRNLLNSNLENREEIIGNLLAILIEESPKDSLYLLSRLTVQNPDSAYIMAQASVAYDKINKSEEALLLMRKASEIDRDNLEYKYNLAVMSDKASNFQDALYLYNEVLSAYSASEGFNISVQEIEERIKAIKSQL